MGYAVALNKAWDDLVNFTKEKIFSVKFLCDEYTLDLDKREILSLSCNAVPPEHVSILILHYLKQKVIGLPELAGKWMSFKETAEGIAYYPSFHKRVVIPILKKYGAHPENILEVIKRFPGRQLKEGDIAVAIDVFPEVPIAVLFWKGDSEFGPEANVLFDKSVLKILCIEDMVVLAEVLAHSL